MHTLASTVQKWCSCPLVTAHLHNDRCDCASGGSGEVKEDDSVRSLQISGNIVVYFGHFVVWPFLQVSDTNGKVPNLSALSPASIHTTSLSCSCPTGSSLSFSSGSSTWNRRTNKRGEGFLLSLGSSSAFRHAWAIPTTWSDPTIWCHTTMNELGFLDWVFGNVLKLRDRLLHNSVLAFTLQCYGIYVFMFCQSRVCSHVTTSLCQNS